MNVTDQVYSGAIAWAEMGASHRGETVVPGKTPLTGDAAKVFTEGQLSAKSTEEREEQGRLETEEVDEAADEAAKEEAERKLRREAQLTYLQLYRETYGAPEEKQDQEEAARMAEVEDEDEEDEAKRMRRGAKTALVTEDLQEPGKTQVFVYSYDSQGKARVTRRHEVDTGENDNKKPNRVQGETDGRQEPEKQSTSLFV